MSRIASARSAGSIIRRFREEQGLSRAALSQATGIGARTIYALEQGESRNFGLENLLKLLDALGLSMSIDLNVAQQPTVRREQRPARAHLAPTALPKQSATKNEGQSAPFPEYELADIWKLD